MTRQYAYAIQLIGTVALLAAGCSDAAPVEGPVDFHSQGAHIVRDRACSQDWQTAAHKGTGAETFNASTMWSVSPYLLLMPATGRGYVQLNVDAPHYDWLLFTTADSIQSLSGPELTFNGPVLQCPEMGLVEYGAHHAERSMWLLGLNDTDSARVRFYAGLAATDHSDPDESGHAGDDGDAPDHGGH